MQGRRHRAGVRAGRRGQHRRQQAGELGQRQRGRGLRRRSGARTGSAGSNCSAVGSARLRRNTGSNRPSGSRSAIARRDGAHRTAQHRGRAGGREQQTGRPPGQGAELRQAARAGGLGRQQHQRRRRRSATPGVPRRRSAAARCTARNAPTTGSRTTGSGTAGASAGAALPGAMSGPMSGAGSAADGRCRSGVGFIRTPDIVRGKDGRCLWRNSSLAKTATAPFQAQERDGIFHMDVRPNVSRGASRQCARLAKRQPRMQLVPHRAGAGVADPAIAWA